MLDTFESNQFSDSNGNPAGGQTFGRGFTIAWQNGPLATPDVTADECIHPHIISDTQGDLGHPTSAEGPCRRAPNGAFVETIIAAARDRLEFYQASPFNCETNQEAIDHLTKAIEALNRRTADREARGVEGTHQA